MYVPSHGRGCGRPLRHSSAPFLRARGATGPPQAFLGVGEGGLMTDPRKHESEDLEDYEVLDANDTLDGNPGDDPLDRGVAAPDRWSAGTRYALEGEENSES